MPFIIGELFQSHAVGKSRKNITALMDMGDLIMLILRLMEA